MSAFLTILAAVMVAALLVGVIVRLVLLKSDLNRVPNPQSQGETGDPQYAEDLLCDGNHAFDCGGAD